MSQGRVFYSVLNMGLGHAARSLPIIREFINRDWQILIGSSGRALAFLQRELPELQFARLPDYGIRYSRNGWLLPKLAAQLPVVLSRIWQENKSCWQIVHAFSPDLILSDHCYGINNPGIPSFFLSHQINFAMPKGFDFVQPLPAQFNFHFHKHFKAVFIPDSADTDGGLLSGNLSRTPAIPGKYHHCGILSSVERQSLTEDLDVFITISGPEPQRSILEDLVLDQVHKLAGKIVVAMGKSESAAPVYESNRLQIYPYLTREQMTRCYNRARLVVTRPGYTSLMELAELGKKALLIPTPGQTEQLYLARRLEQKGWFYSVPQQRLDLPRDLQIAQTFSGLFLPNATHRAVKYIFERILNVAN